VKDLLRWLELLARRSQARPELFEALLTGRWRPYAWHRLRFMLPRMGVRLVIQAFEVFVLSAVVPWEYLTPLFSYRASSSLLGGTYWGGLEELRARVRGDARARRYESARIAIEGWLGISLLLACACLLGIGAWIRFFAEDSGLAGGFSLFDAYGMACFLRLALDLVSRTYHAGIFALTRVYRPLATMLLPDLLELGIVVLSWKQLGPWGIVLSIIVAGVLRTGWAYYYSRKAYKLSRIPLPCWTTIPRSFRTLTWSAVRSSALHAVASATGQLDSLLILALAHAPIDESNGVPLVVVYYVFRPVMSAAHGWTRVFYFDWKRLEGGIGRAFQPRMRALLTQTAVAVVVVAGVLLLVSNYLMWRGALWANGGALLLLFAGRTAFSVEQLEAFSLGQYARLGRLAVAVVLAFLVFDQLQFSALVIVVGAALVLIAATAWSRARRDDSGREEHFRGFAPWLVRLAATREPVQVYSVCADRRIAPAARVYRALHQAFAPLRVARAGQSHVVSFASAHDAPRPGQVVAALGGAVYELKRYEASTGRAAIERMIVDGWFMRVLGLDLTAVPPTRTELLAEFRACAPQGHILELDVGRGRVSSEALSWGVRRLILRELASRAIGHRPRPRQNAPCRLAVLAVGGVPSVVFVALREMPKFSEFRQKVEFTSVRAAIGM